LQEKSVIIAEVMHGYIKKAGKITEQTRKTGNTSYAIA